jgi:hypothetical protein
VLLWVVDVIYVDIRAATLVILAGFGAVTICGVGESAGVAAALLATHMAVLMVLIIWGFIYGIQDGFSTFHDNMYSR